MNVRGRDIVIYHRDGKYYGLINKCPHEGGSLFHGPCMGLVESNSPGTYRYNSDIEVVRCPWHGWEFDIRTGKLIVDPDGMRARPVKVEAGVPVFEPLPPDATTVEVTQQDEDVLVYL